MNRNDALLFALNNHIHELRAGRGARDPWCNYPFERDEHLYISVVNHGFMERLDWGQAKPYVLTQAGRDAARAQMLAKMREFMATDVERGTGLRKAPVNSTMFYIYEEGARLGRCIKIETRPDDVAIFELTKLGRDFCAKEKV